MRKGFSLVETLVAMAVLASVSVALAALFTTIIDDIPRCYRLVQENTSLLNMLEHLRKDVAAARSLPRSVGQYAADSDLLLIELVEGVISYQLKDGEVVRCKTTTASQDEQPGHMEIWPVPHAEVRWKVWRENGNGYALEVKTHIEHKVRGRCEEKMANSHLYFVGMPPEVME